MAAFFTYAAMSLFWAPQTDFSIFGLWAISIWWMSLRVGLTKSLTEEFEFDPAGDSPLWAGLAFGLAINSAVAIAQAIGYAPVITNQGTVAGLFYNSTLLSAVAALAILGCVEARLWYHIPMILPSLVLAQGAAYHSRGGFAILAVGLLSKLHRLAAFAALGLIATAALLTLNDSNAYRLEIWGATWHNLSLFGSGTESYASFFIINHAAGTATHPEFAHNDFLQLWFEYGIVALIPIALLIAGARTPVGVGTLALACFYFPLYTPVTAFIAFYIVGRNLRYATLAKLHRHLRGSALLRRSADAQPLAVHSRREDLPVQLGAARDRKERLA
jgi:hypothetical protein